MQALSRISLPLQSSKSTSNYVPSMCRGTKMLEDKRLGAVLFKGPNGRDKAAGSSRTAGRHNHASQQGQLATLITIDCGI